MVDLHIQYITDDLGKKLSVVLPVAEFHRLLEQLEQLEDVQLYDRVKAKDELSMPIDEAFEWIESHKAG
ncbi:MAG TPA: hypothetical protein PKA00_04030 [Saprospiraceae bacterium]|nr:hypothetical protein [Saprospiraceae bacterium]HMQ82047.1 hypothetical protein [Saprospiraceae bacterium]